MATRREAREWAVQILFQLDLNASPDDAMQSVFDEFWANQLRMKIEETKETVDEKTFEGGWRDRVAEKRIRQFTERIVLGVRQNIAKVDETLAKYARNWDVHRMGGIERNVLRMGIYELLFRAKDVPVAVVINEAVDVGKFFGTRESGRFINGILDSIAKERPAEGTLEESWTPTA